MTAIELVPDRTRLLIIITRDGRPPHRDRFDPVTAKARAKQADACGVTADQFADWCEQVRVKGGPLTFHPPGEDRQAEGQVTIRGITQTAAEARSAGPISGFLAQWLQSVRVDEVAQWDGKHELCCLDIDYHDNNAPARDWLEAVVRTRVSPAPVAWHFSRSGGLHLFYTAAGPHAADQLAACAALRFRTIDGAAGVELKTIVRGPGPEPVHRNPTGADVTGTFLSWLDAAEASDTARESWLDSEGMECGQRYSHDRCPIDPGPNSKADKPVLVSEAGVYCFRCNAKGLTWGSRQPGFVPWPALLGAPSSGELGTLVRRQVHWGHAKYVFTERYELPERLAKLAFRAALCAYHEGKPTADLIPAVFDERTDEIARVANQWVTVDQGYAYQGNISALVSRLPIAQFVDNDGKSKVDAALVTELTQSKDLSRYGYKSVELVHGYKLTGPFLNDTRVTRVGVPNPALREFGTRCLPRYRRPADRMSPDEAWATIEQVLPRVDRKLIRTLLVAFGCAQETRRGLLPVLFVAGPSAAGKSVMCQLACGILGAQVGAEGTYEPENAKFRTQIRDGALKGPLVVFNELLKEAARSRNKATFREALDFVLNLTEDSVSHKLHTGAVPMGKLPAIVITEPLCPVGLQDETQLARRIRYHEVEGRKDDWRRTIANAGINKLSLIRTVSDRVAKACDAILSDVIDTYFAVPSNWDDLADTLGVQTVEKSDAFEDQTPWLKELFRLVCRAPELEGKDAKLYSGGFKKISRDQVDSDLVTVYSKFADDSGSAWCHSRRLTEKDWTTILRHGASVWIDLRQSQNDVFIRFGVGPRNRPTHVNEQIVTPDWEGLL